MTKGGMDYEIKPSHATVPLSIKICTFRNILYVWGTYFCQILENLTKTNVKNVCSILTVLCTKNLYFEF